MLCHLRLRHVIAVLALTVATAADVHAQQVYTLGPTGVIKALQFGPCLGTACRWTDVDNNARTVGLTGGPDGLFQLHENGQIWKWRGEHCLSGSCPGWVRLDANPRTQAIIAEAGELFQRHSDGSIWRWLGQPCGAGGCRSWERLDSNRRTREIVTAGGELYQRHDNGSIWQWMGEPCEGGRCGSWRRLDANPATVQIAARGDDLFQRHSNGSIWRWRGEPCGPGGCRSWERLDNNPRTRALVAARGGLYQRHEGGAIWQWMGAPCSGSSCLSWQRLDNNPNTVQIAAAGEALYQIHRSGEVWRWQGSPCTHRCASWERVAGSGTVVAGSELFAFDGQAFASAPTSRSGRPTLTAAERESRLSPFGYRTHEAVGTRPLLTILLNAVDASGAPIYPLLSTSQYDQIIYSRTPGVLSVANFMAQSSRGAFSLTRAGLVQVTDAAAGSTPTRTLTLADAAVNFAIYDRNGDGNVDESELAILIIDNLSQGLGASRGACATLDGVLVCRPVALAGGLSSFDNFAHEVGHQLGPTDIYGASCFLQVVALMGHCTATTTVTSPLRPISVGFGPWNRMRFGWLQPEPVSATSPGTCKPMVASSYAFASADEALLVFDPARGATEYFLLEHRTNTNGNSFRPYDSLFPGSGLVPFFVRTRTDPEGDIRWYTDGAGRRVQDRWVYMSNDPLRQRRLPGALAPDGTPTDLIWSNGAASGMSIRARYLGAVPGAMLEVEVEGTAPFPPSFSSMPATGPLLLNLARGQEHTLPNGVFGIDANGRSLELRNGDGARISLPTREWSCNSIRVAVPATTSFGEYQLVATHTDWLSSHPLNVKVRVR